ncbi:uncharacterized protein V6R79_020923 [Siganus canaliculatus]
MWSIPTPTASCLRHKEDALQELRSLLTPLHPTKEAPMIPRGHELRNRNPAFYTVTEKRDGAGSISDLEPSV